MNTYQEQAQTDEIDLRKLFEILWKNKHLIFTITAFFTIAGVAYAFLAPQEWCAKAIVAIPSTTKVEKLQRKIEDLIVLSKNGVNNPISTSYYNNFIDSFTETKLLADFAQAFNSFDNKIEFLKSNNYIRQDGMDERARLRSLEKTTKKIAAHQKKNETFYTLTFVADNAKNASKRLSEYLEFIQAKEVEIKNQLLADKIANQINALTLNFQAQKTETLKRLQEDITRTELALRISKTAGIEGPIENLNNQGVFTIDLGAKALNEKLKILKEIKSPELINPALADIRLQLDSFQTLPHEKASFTSYSFLQSPTEPLSRDKPLRYLVISLATLTGLILGVMVALIYRNISIWKRDYSVPPLNSSLTS